MDISRRQLSFLLPVLAASGARAQQAAPVEVMTSKVYPGDQIPYTGDENKKARTFFLDATHGGFQVQMHETDLGPGVVSHPPHQHEHEEVLIVTAGTLEANLDGTPHPVPTGSVVVFGSNQPHNVRNPGATTAKYYVVEFRGREA